MRPDVLSRHFPALDPPRRGGVVLARACGGDMGRTDAASAQAGGAMALGQAGSFHRLLWAFAAFDLGLGAWALPDLGVSGGGEPGRGNGNPSDPGGARR